MKKFNKVLATLIMTVVVLSLAVFTAYAVETEAGNTVTVTFTIPQTYTVDGYFDFSNPDLFTAVTFANDTAHIGELSNERVYLYANEASDVTIEVTVTVSAGANVGDKCDITLRYETGDLDGNMSDWNTKTETVVVVGPAETEPVQTEPVPTEPVETEPQPVEPEPTPVPPTADPMAIIAVVSAVSAVCAAGTAGAFAIRRKSK